MTIQKLKEKFKLMTNEEETLIYLKPLNEYSFETYPLLNIEEAIQVTLEEYIGLRLGIYKFDSDLKNIIENIIENND